MPTKHNEAYAIPALLDWLSKLLELVSRNTKILTGAYYPALYRARHLICRFCPVAYDSFAIIRATTVSASAVPLASPFSKSPSMVPN